MILVKHHNRTTNHETAESEYRKPMLQTSTYAVFQTFPSTSDDQYRSMKPTVAVEVEDLPEGQFVAVEADFLIADGRSIAGVDVAASGFIEDPQFISEVLSARADLEAFKQTFDVWYAEALAAFTEAEVAVQEYIAVLELESSVA